MSKVAQVWPIIGIWETDSLDEGAVEKDSPILEAILRDLDRSVTFVKIEVVIHGRKWKFTQVGPRFILVGVD